MANTARERQQDGKHGIGGLTACMQRLPCSITHCYCLLNAKTPPYYVLKSAKRS